MMRAVFSLTAAAALFASGVQAQTFADAARANMAIAAQFCLQPGLQGPMRAANFRASGFAERVDRSTSNSDTTHYFSAPGETVLVELYYGEMPQHCFGVTQFMGVTGTSEVLDQLIPKLFPGFIRKVQQGLVNPVNGQPAICVTYEDPSNPIGLAIGATPGGGANGCVDNGTSSFFSTYRV